MADQSCPRVARSRGVEEHLFVVVADREEQSSCTGSIRLARVLEMTPRGGITFIMRLHLLIVCLFTSVALAARPASGATTVRPVDPKHTLLIKNGKIIDGTGNPWFSGDVLIRGAT